MPTPCTVSGTLNTLSAGKIAQGTVIFQLGNIGAGNVPRVLGTTILPGTQFSAMTDQSGNFSISLWGNDNIDPAGTLYLVTFRDYLKNEIGPVSFNITGLTFNLNSAVHS
jgi:hypothetical protein